MVDCRDPVTGSSAYDAIALKKISERIAEATLLHASKAVGTARREVSDDGRTLTITYEGQQIKNKALYDKQE